ncbi:M48 family metalloprotease [Acinetobacter baumannii]|nr:M48 family metalloprotease [Acinetobacter baumannii]
MNDIEKKFIEELLKHNPNIKTAKTGYIIPLKDGNFFHYLGMTNASYEQACVEKYGNEARWYTSFCSESDLEKIFRPRTAIDEILAFQAKSISWHPRIFRVFKKRKGNSQSWSLEKYYKKILINDRYLKVLSKGNLKKVEKIPVNMAYFESVNAYCMKEKNTFIVVSEPLEQFLFFMNLFAYANIPSIDKMASFMIAMRTILGFESYDFDLDPRFDFLDDEYIELAKLKTRFQIDFIIGHEYSHYLLGHLNSKNSVTMKMSMLNRNIKSEDKINTYYYSRKNEYEADWYAIKNITGDNNYKNELTNAAFDFFIYLSAFEKVKSFFGSNHSYTHPDATSRLLQLRKKINRKFGFTSDELEDYLNNMSQFTDNFICNYLVTNVEQFEIKGSFYLPSYTKHPLRQDRIDF